MQTQKIYGLLFIFVLLPGLNSMLAQEQMTYFQGAPCCYNASQIIHYGDHTIAIARDHQKGVKIYTLKGEDAFLHFSNHDEDKYSLYAQSATSDFYYLIYNDRLELFHFDSLRTKTYEFPEPLNMIQSGEGGGLRMTDHGLLFIPESRGDSLKFFNLKTQKFEQLTNTVSRNDYAVFVDSFMFFMNQESEFVAMLSHNLLSNESRKLYTATSTDFEFKPLKDALYFRDDHNVYSTRGRPSNTHFLFQRDSGHDRIEQLSTDSGLAFLTYGNDQQIQYYKFDDSGQLLSEELLRFPYDVVITDFRLNANEEIVFSTALNALYASAGNRDTLLRVDEFDQYDFALDAHLIYYVKDNRFWSYNTLSRVQNSISSMHQFGLLYNLVIPSDSMFYWMGKEEGSSVGFLGYHRTRDNFFHILEFGEYSDGAEDMNIEKVGAELFLQGPSISTHVLVNDQFQQVGAVDIVSDFIQFQGTYYAVGADQNLYEWNDSNGLIPRITNLPLPNDQIELSIHNGRLIAFNYEAFLIELNVKDQTFEALIPEQGFELLELMDWNTEFFVYILESSNQKIELWSYDVEGRQWTKLLNEGDQIVDQRGEVAEILNDKFLWTEENIQLFNIKAIHLKTAELELSIKLNFSNRNANLELFSKCNDELILYFYSELLDIKRLLVTDGTLANYRNLAESDAYWGFQIPYLYEGQLYFSDVDSFNTTVHQYKCNGGELDQEDWSIPLISQGQYKLGDHTFILGNQRVPRQNLTVAERDGDQITEIAIAPQEFGFFGRRNGQIRGEVPVLTIDDTTLAVVASFDRTGAELWVLEADRDFYRTTDLNEGPFNAQIEELTVHEGYLYFTGYKYGPGHQVWRIPINKNMTNSSREVYGNDLTIAPNPVREQFRIEHAPKGKAELRITDRSGQLVYRSTITIGAESPVVVMSGLPEGLYFLDLYLNHRTYSATVLKVD